MADPQAHIVLYSEQPPTFLDEIHEIDMRVFAVPTLICEYSSFTEDMYGIGTQHVYELEGTIDVVVVMN